MAELRLVGIEKKLGDQPILRGIDLHAKSGELVMLVGASGCGKSTLLRVIAGLALPDEGKVELDGKDMTSAAPKDRDIAMVFQSYALYPHVSVRDNLSFGLKLRGSDKATIQQRVSEVSEMLGLTPLLDRLPRELSGGQRQRVAMGRAIARRPKLFLFDEPLSNLDAKLRNRVRVEIKALHRKLATTMVYVTHDQLEAMTLADRLVVLDKGVVQQEGTPLEIFERPKNTFVAGFIGSPPMNLLERTSFANVDAPPKCATIGVRPHQLSLHEEASERSFAATVLAVEPMGAETWVHGEIETGMESGEHDALSLEGPGHVVCIVRSEEARGAGEMVGKTLHWRAEADALHFFDETGARIE